MDKGRGTKDEKRILFVTGKLAEPSLRRVLPSLGVNYEIAVMPITVAALLTVPWIARRIQIPEGVERIVLPGFCSGNIAELEALTNVPVERGPKDLRDLPEHFAERTVVLVDHQHHAEAADRQHEYALEHGHPRDAAQAALGHVDGHHAERDERPEPVRNAPAGGDAEHHLAALPFELEIAEVQILVRAHEQLAHRQAVGGWYLLSGV